MRHQRKILLCEKSVEVDNNNDCEKSHRNARTTIEICGSHYYDEYIRQVLS